MMAYSNMTLQQAYDRIIMKLGNHRSNMNTDWGTIVKIVNRGLREVMVSTLPYKEWAYNNALSVSHRTVLPHEYLKHIRCMVSVTGQPPFIEARYVAPREYFKVNDWHGRNEWMQAVNLSPIYTIWSEHDMLGLPPQLKVFLSPNNQWETGTAPPGYRYNNMNVSGVLECYMVPPDVSDPADILPVPYEFEDMVILSATTRLLAKTTDMQRLVSMHKHIMREKANVMKRYEEKRRTERREMESYTEPVVPLVPHQTEPGELETGGR